MTAYNRERYIDAAIASIQVQTLRNWELIIVDDKSTDLTHEIAARYALHDSRIQVYRNTENLGDYPNRNHAASFVRGDFMKYHDSDDVMYPHCLETMHSLLAAHPCAHFAMSGSHSWEGAPAPIQLTPRESFQRQYLGPGDLFKWGPACALFRTKSFREIGGFPPHGVASDAAFWMIAFARFCVLLVPADLFWYRRHSGQELQKPDSGRQYALYYNKMWHEFSSANALLTPAEFEVARRNVLWDLVRGAWYSLRSGQWELARLHLRGVSIWTILRMLRRPLRSPLAGIGTDPSGDPSIPPWLRPSGNRDL